MLIDEGMQPVAPIKLGQLDLLRDHSHLRGDLDLALLIFGIEIEVITLQFLHYCHHHVVLCVNAFPAFSQLAAVQERTQLEEPGHGRTVSLELLSYIFKAEGEFVLQRSHLLFQKLLGFVFNAENLLAQASLQRGDLDGENSELYLIGKHILNEEVVGMYQIQLVHEPRKVLGIIKEQKGYIFFG